MLVSRMIMRITHKLHDFCHDSEIGFRKAVNVLNRFRYYNIDLISVSAICASVTAPTQIKTNKCFCLFFFLKVISELYHRAVLFLYWI